MTRIGAESGRCRWVLGLAVMVVLSLLAFGSARAEEFDLSGLGPDAQAALGPIRYASAVSMRQPPPAEKPRAPLLRRQRPNTISIGIQGDYGIIRGNSRLADGFSDGPGYSFRFRYMLAPSFALGFSFESQRFYDKGGLPSTELGAGDSTVVMTTVGMEGVFYIHREREVNPYFVTGFGYASPDVVDELRGRFDAPALDAHPDLVGRLGREAKMAHYGDAEFDEAPHRIDHGCAAFQLDGLGAALLQQSPC